jgi:RNA polymerase sigma-70 factor, ECF subfamily
MTTTADPSHVAHFEVHRRALTGLAYRMLGSRTEAEDVMQDAYLRWHSLDSAAIDEPRRYLATVVTRLCLDRMKSAWRGGAARVVCRAVVAEPVVDEVFDDEVTGDLARDITVALMIVLEPVSPLEGELSAARRVRPRFC